jgi:hypothetical protein
MMFVPGQHILYRGPHVDDGGTTGPPVICDLKPAVVVEDSERAVILYIPNRVATLVSRPVPAGRPKPWGPGEWELAPTGWDRWHALFVHRPGEWRATWVLWTPEWEFLGWYVNLQEPLWRTRWGFDNRDLQLDIVVGPGRRWRWKDEDDLSRSIACGLISEAKAAATRESADAAIAEIEGGRWPFDDVAVAWRPEADCVMPALPAGDALAAVLRWTEGDSLGRV